MSEDIPFLDRLGEQLDAARIPPRRRPAGRRGAIVAGAALLAVVAVLGVAVRPQPAAAGVDVTRHDGRIELRLTDFETPISVIEDAINRNGLHLRVKAVPVGPSFVGRFLSGTGALPPEMRQIGSDGAEVFTGFSIPIGWDGDTTLYVGRSAHGDEAYQVSSDAFAPDEPLACTGLLHAPARRAIRALRPMGLRARWLTTGPDGQGAFRDVPLEEVVTGPYDGYRVAQALRLSRDAVIIMLTADGTLPFLRQAPEPRPC